MHDPKDTGDRTEGTGDTRKIYLNNALVPDRTMESRWYGDVGAHLKEVDLEATLDHLVTEDNNLMSIDRAAASDEILRMMSYLDLNEKEANQFTGVLNQALPEAKPAEWAKESRKRLSRTYGKEAGERLQSAQTVVDRNPKLKAFLNKYKLDNHPDLIELIAKKAPVINRRYE
ncbi:MAG: hypothetical protein N0E44_15760 [Candidatus Thiodiazotropha lotti]|nr:hypothetical protein [Candidatus Thiodiazotropha lotti]MCW4221340.1 hypothetical protein [Candidatus Thiodiazotropha lotti]